MGFEEGKTGVPQRRCAELTIPWGLLEGAGHYFLGYPTCSGALFTLAKRELHVAFQPWAPWVYP